MKNTILLFTLAGVLFCQKTVAQQAFLDEFVPGAKWGMRTNELAELRPNIFVDRNAGPKQNETGPRTEQLDGNPMATATYHFGWPDTLGLIAVDFVCLDRETALGTVRKFVGDMENNSTHFWKMEDGSSVTMMVSGDRINLRWYALRRRK